MRRIAVSNQKGGVGKTSTSTNLSYALSERGNKVLVVDCDSQRNCTSGLLGGEEKPEPTLWEVLNGEANVSEAILKITEDLDLLPSSIQLAAADVVFATRIGRENLLKKALSGLRYDIIIYDCPPSLGLMTVNAFMASVEIIVPVKSGPWELEGLAMLEETVGMVREDMGHKRLHFMGGLHTIVDPNTLVSKDCDAYLREYFGDKYFKTTIPKATKVNEANSRALPMSAYAPGSPVAVAYDSLAEEVIARG